MNVEVALLASPSLISLMISVDVKHNERRRCCCLRAQELCGSQGGRPGLSIPNYSPYGLCGRKATLNLNLIAWLSVSTDQ